MTETKFFNAAGAAEYLNSIGVKISVRTIEVQRAIRSERDKAGWPFRSPFGCAGSLVISKEALDKIASGVSPW